MLGVVVFLAAHALAWRLSRQGRFGLSVPFKVRVVGGTVRCLSVPLPQASLSPLRRASTPCGCSCFSSLRHSFGAFAHVGLLTSVGRGVLCLSGRQGCVMWEQAVSTAAGDPRVTTGQQRRRRCSCGVQRHHVRGLYSVGVAASLCLSLASLLFFAGTLLRLLAAATTASPRAAIAVAGQHVTPLVPGVTVPLSQWPYFFIALFVSVVVVSTTPPHCADRVVDLQLTSA